MGKLSWIDDSNLVNAVLHLLSTAKKAQQQSEDEFDKNVIDPFSALFQISGFEIDYNEWLLAEKTRQAQKTLQNHIGEFHQIILGGVNGWSDLGVGSEVDLVSSDRKIIAEIKNKHNTVTGGSLSNLYRTLDSLVSNKASVYKGFVSYYVTVVPKSSKRFNKPFTPSDKQKGARCALNQDIRIVDGASFYELVTGEKDALLELFSVLPDFVTQISGRSFSQTDKDNLMDFFLKAYD